MHSECSCLMSDAHCCEPGTYRSYHMASVFILEVVFTILQRASNVCVPNNVHIIYASAHTGMCTIVMAF